MRQMQTLEDAGYPIRLALDFDEAAARLSVSRDHFDRHIAPDLKLIRSGRRRLVPVSELTRWVEENAARALEGQP
jgi:excisionase family DNA binding protein